MAPSISGPDRAMGVVIAAVVAYLLGLALFYPASTINRDEVYYLEMAYAFAGGSACLEQVDALTGATRCEPSGNFLPGMSLSMAPFVALFGWRGGYLVPALAIAVATLCTAAWLRAAGRSPLFALLVLGYPPTLVLGRVAMSDVPSTALVALGLWLFWTGGTKRRMRWLASGFVAGLSFSFRETNVLLFAPVYLGSLIRREPGVGALITGGIAGVLLRSLSTAAVFGDPLYIFPVAPSFGLGNWIANLPTYALALLVFVPGGLIAGLLYRGERRLEVVTTVVVFCALYLSFGYRGEQSGWLKGLILGPRYFAPLTPLLAFAAGEVVPRLWARWRAHRGGGPQLGRLGRLGVGLWVIGVFVLAFAVHPASAVLSGSSVRFRAAIYGHSAPGSVVVIDEGSSNKVANALFGDRLLVHFGDLKPATLAALLRRHGMITLALLDRDDSAYWRQRRRANGEALDRLRSRADFELLYEGDGAPGEHLRIWRVRPQPGDRSGVLGENGGGYRPSAWSVKKAQARACWGAGMKVVMTGAGGGVAKMTRPHLVGAFDQLIVSGRRPVGELLEGETFVQADLTDLAAMERLLEGADGLIHLGGQAVEADWETIQSANITGLYNTYEACRRQGVERIVFATTNHVVGFHRRTRTIDHEAMPRPDSRYGASKAFGEAFGRLYADKHGLRVFNIRIGNVGEQPLDLRRLAIWISPRDMAQLFRIGLEHPDIHYEIVYGASRNARAWWDNGNAYWLGYQPEDEAEDYAEIAHTASASQPEGPVAAQFHGGPFAAAEFTGDVRRID